MQRLATQNEDDVSRARCAVWQALPDLVQILASTALEVVWVPVSSADCKGDALSGRGCCQWLIVDGRCAPGQAAAFVEKVRALEYWGPVLAILAESGLESATQLFRLDARLLIGAPSEEDLRLFLVRSARAGREHAWVQRATKLWRFTAREREILRLSVTGAPRSLLPALLALSDNTVKTHVRSLLRKSGTSSIPELVGRLYGADLYGADPSGTDPSGG